MNRLALHCLDCGDRLSNTSSNKSQPLIENRILAATGQWSVVMPNLLDSKAAAIKGKAWLHRWMTKPIELKPSEATP